MKSHNSKNSAAFHGRIRKAGAFALLGLIVAAIVSAFIHDPVTALATLPLLGTLLEPEVFQKKLLEGLGAVQSGQDSQTKALDELKAKLLAVEGDQQKTAEAFLAYQKAQAAHKSRSNAAARPGEVNEECARYLGAIGLLAGVRQGHLQSNDRVDGVFKEVTGIEMKSALTSSDIPLPTEYNGQVVELVSMWGMARKYGTVFPLGAGTVKLPRLGTDTTFGLIASSGTVTEKSPTIVNVTFTAEKFGGLVRLPSEIDEDSIVPMGQFLARYAARNLARVEDTNFFAGSGAGSGINGSVEGLAYSTITNSKVVQQASTKTKTSDVTLANLRAIRATVDAPVIATGAYYMHPSMEQALNGLNTAGDKPYNANASQGATLDGYPIRWIDCLPVYSTSAQVSKVYVLFGDVSYQYLGIRGGIRFDTSREAGFTTDEILVRALERLTIGLMATGAVSGLETAAS